VTYPESPFITYNSKFYVNIDNGAFLDASDESIGYPGFKGDLNNNIPSRWYFQVDPIPDVIIPTLINSNALFPEDTIKQLNPIPISVSE
jgi:hypothetical protein